MDWTQTARIQALLALAPRIYPFKIFYKFRSFRWIDWTKLINYFFFQGLATSCTYCDASIPSENHPLIAMYDLNFENGAYVANKKTWWQSTTMKAWHDKHGSGGNMDANITIAYDHHYILQVRTIILLFLEKYMCDCKCFG